MAGQAQRASFTLDDKAFRAALTRELRGLGVKAEADLVRLAIRVQNQARRYCPVDTGRLRSSIQHTPGRDARGPFVDVGTNVEYAAHVEFGTRYQAAQPYLRPALLDAARWWRQEAS